MMAILNWTSDLDTGIAEIDNQHRRIVDYINRLNELRHTHDRAGLSDVIGEMVDYTMSHFALSRWLFNHIRNEDHGYIDSVKAYQRMASNQGASAQERLKAEVLAELREERSRRKGWLARLFGL